MHLFVKISEIADAVRIRRNLIKAEVPVVEKAAEEKKKEKEKRPSSSASIDKHNQQQHNRFEKPYDSERAIPFDQSSTKSKMDDEVMDEEQYEESLSKLQAFLCCKSILNETLEAKFAVEDVLEDIFSTSPKYQETEEKTTNKTALLVSKSLEDLFEQLQGENVLHRSTHSLNIIDGTTASANASIAKGVDSTWPLLSDERPERAHFDSNWKVPSQSIKADNIRNTRYSVEIGTDISPLNNKRPSGEVMERRRYMPPAMPDVPGRPTQRDGCLSRPDFDYQSNFEGSCGSVLCESEAFDDFISYQNMLHNVVEMLKKLEEHHKKWKNRGLYDQIWSSDLEMWKQRTQYRINALRVLIGNENGSCASSMLQNRVLYRPDDFETDEIVQGVNSKYQVLRRNYCGNLYTELTA